MGRAPEQIEALLNRRYPLAGCLAGRVQRTPHRERWLALALPQECESLVRWGYEWEWKQGTPPKDRFMNRRFNASPEEEAAVSAALLEYQGLGACRQVPRGALHWASPVFARPKPHSEKWRLIADLSVLNRYILSSHFKMEGLQDAVHLATPNCWFSKLDLSNAYFHIGMKAPTQGFLGFWWRGQWWTWTALPFGLVTAPRVFSKLVKQAVRAARELGVVCVVYIDDLLVIAPDQLTCRTNVLAMAAFFQRLGLTVNFKKSVLSPTQEIEFLGLVLNSVTQTVSVSAEKLAHLQRDAKTLTRREALPTRELAAFLGRLVAVRPAIPVTLLHTRHLELCKVRAVHEGGWEGQSHLTPEAVTELVWWATKARDENGAPWSHPPPTWVLTTDAALEVGWGGTLARVPMPETANPRPPSKLVRTTAGLEMYSPSSTSRANPRLPQGSHEMNPRLPPRSLEMHPLSANPRWKWLCPSLRSNPRLSAQAACHEKTLEARGVWTPLERAQCVSINRMELESGIRCLRLLGERAPIRGCTIRWRTDNQVVAVSVFKTRAKSTDMLSGVLELVELAKRLDIHLVTEYLPGVENTRADHLSRREEKQDWMLHPLIFDKICKIRFLPTLDCFASKLNHQVERWFSWVWEEGSAGADFFTQSLEGELCYANPPFSLISRVLAELEKQAAKMLLVVPNWTTQPWWSRAMAMMTSPPVLLPRSEETFLPVRTLNQVGVGPAHWESWCLELSGNRDEVRLAQDQWGSRLHQPDLSIVQWWLQPGTQRKVTRFRRQALEQLHWSM